MDWILALLAVFAFATSHDRLAFWIMIAAVLVNLGTIAWRLPHNHGNAERWFLPKLLILVILSIAALCIGARAYI